jgi:hypothetical protein
MYPLVCVSSVIIRVVNILAIALRQCPLVVSCQYTTLLSFLKCVVYFQYELLQTRIGLYLLICRGYNDP